MKKEDDLYLCEHCSALFTKEEALKRDFGGEVGGVMYCPACEEEIEGTVIGWRFEK